MDLGRIVEEAESDSDAASHVSSIVVGDAAGQPKAALSFAEASDALIRACRGEQLPPAVLESVSFDPAAPHDDALLELVEKLLEAGASVSCPDEKVCLRRECV